MKALGLLMSAVIGYALGSISTGILVGGLFGIKDIRCTESGSSGTTNVIRNAGFGPGILTLLGDFVKGYAAALAGRALFGSAGMLVGGIAAIAGHDFPVFFGFRGGKGIITSLGVIAVISPRLALFQFALQIVVVLITKYMSAGALANMAVLPFVMALFFRDRADFRLLMPASVIIAALAIFQHRGNIRRLFTGQERRFDITKLLKRRDRS